MSTKQESPTKLARAYIKTQLATMGKYGARPKLGRARYWKLVRDCRRPIEQARKWAPHEQDIHDTTGHVHRRDLSR